MRGTSLKGLIEYPTDPDEDICPRCKNSLQCPVHDEDALGITTENGTLLFLVGMLTITQGGDQPRTLASQCPNCGGDIEISDIGVFCEAGDLEESIGWVKTTRTDGKPVVIADWTL